MLGAVIGDVIASIYEHHNLKRTDFDLFDPNCRFTDDTVLSIATADALLHNKDYGLAYREWGRKYPYAGYGTGFRHWLGMDNPKPYNSFGNGSAMRVSPIGWAFDDLQKVLSEAERSASCTHNHELGIQGAQAVASTVLLGRLGKTKKEIKEFVADNFSYTLNKKLDDIRPEYNFDITCRGTVPVAIIAFLESENFENALRLAVSVGGDSDTLTCITAACAQAYYKDIPRKIVDFVRQKLTPDMLEVVDAFEKKYNLL